VSLIIRVQKGVGLHKRSMSIAENGINQINQIFNRMSKHAYQPT